MSVERCLMLIEQSKGKRYENMTQDEFIAHYQLLNLDDWDLEDLLPLFRIHKIIYDQTKE